MSSRFRRRKRRPRRFQTVSKPRGVIHPRVEKAGPERFGVVSVDCAKARSKWMLCDFYGKVLIPPSVVPHGQCDFAEALSRLGKAVKAHALRDVLVAVERTGRYHHPVQRAFAGGGYEVRTVHPFATKQFRQPANPGAKTDDNDLAAIHRCAVNGFALAHPVVDPSWQELQLLIRHRRDWVRKCSALCCQIKDHLEAAMPGYSSCFPKLWDHPAALYLGLSCGSAEEIRRSDVGGISGWLREAQIGFQERTVRRVLEWACHAPPSDPAASQHRRIAQALNADRVQKERDIQALERDIAGRLARTPYILLLSVVGINVVSAADFAGEMGPIRHYAHSRCITGRAGLYPSRYQSDEVDLADGPLVRCGNRALRAAILGIADNLVTCNRHFRDLAERWAQAGKNPRWTRVKVAMRFCRIAFQMVAGQQVFRHPSIRERAYVLEKLMTFHREHQTGMNQTLADLQAAVDQLPKGEHAAEADPLVKELEAIEKGRRRGPQPIGKILPVVLARLGVRRVQSGKSGVNDPR